MMQQPRHLHYTLLCRYTYTLGCMRFLGYMGFVLAVFPLMCVYIIVQIYIYIYVCNDDDHYQQFNETASSNSTSLTYVQQAQQHWSSSTNCNYRNSQVNGTIQCYVPLPLHGLEHPEYFVQLSSYIVLQCYARLLACIQSTIILEWNGVWRRLFFSLLNLWFPPYNVHVFLRPTHFLFWCPHGLFLLGWTWNYTVINFDVWPAFRFGCGDHLQKGCCCLFKHEWLSSCCV